MPCPGGPKSHSTDVKPISLICFESQWSDLELLKCCAALSECRQSTVMSWAAKSGTPPTFCALRCATVLATNCLML